MKGFPIVCTIEHRSWSPAPALSGFHEVIAQFILAIDISEIIYFQHIKCQTKPTWVLTNHDIFKNKLHSLINSKSGKRRKAQECVHDYFQKNYNVINLPGLTGGSSISGDHHREEDLHQSQTWTWKPALLRKWKKGYVFLQENTLQHNNGG